MNDKKKYIAPELTAVTFKVESGFALSSFSNMFNESLDPLFDENLMEYWEFDDSPDGTFGHDVLDDWGWD